MATPIPGNGACFSEDELVFLFGALGNQNRSDAEVSAFLAQSKNSGAEDDKSQTSFICGVSTDTRTLKKGNLFVALNGASAEGYLYVEAAAEKGAKCIVVECKKIDLSFFSKRFQDILIFEVDDTLVALETLASFYLRRLRAKDKKKRVALITGSSGKTTTKEMASALLSQKGFVQKTIGNLNNRIGLPMTVFTFEETHDFLVLEAGMSQLGEMSRLAQLAKADVALILNVGLAHAEGVDGPDGVAHEKGEIYRYMALGGTAIVNENDPLVCSQWLQISDERKAQINKLTQLSLSTATPNKIAQDKLHCFGQEGKTISCPLCDVQKKINLLSSVPFSSTGARICFERQVRSDLQSGGEEAGGEKKGEPRELFDISSPFVGEAQALDLAAAMLVAEALSESCYSRQEVEDALKRVTLEGRSTILQRKDGLLVIDDTYNANPDSMREALEMMKRLSLLPFSSRSGQHGTSHVNQAPRRKIAVFGEMKELGVFAEQAHKELGFLVAEAGVDILITCGGMASLIASEAALNKVHKVTCLVAKNVDEAANLALQTVSCQDVVLVKASRSVQLEKLVRWLC